MKKLILIDGNSIFHRAFYAIPPSLKTESGEPINAVYGFISMLLNLLNKEKPDCIGVAWDVKEKTFRHKEYDDYKATRTKAPDELYVQLPIVKDILKIMQIPIFECPGFEADDILGTLAHQADQRGDTETFIVTGDRDALQLASPYTKIIMPIRGFSQTALFGPKEVLHKYGITPDQVPDQKGLQGDSSDNIKGVQGVGEKTALTLIQKYKSIEGIYDHLDEIKGKLKEKLENDRENAFLSKKLATIVKDVPSKLDMQDCKIHEYNKEEVQKTFQDYKFNSLINKFETFDRYYTKKREEEKIDQPSLF